jgi:hypothetical protein
MKKHNLGALVHSVFSAQKNSDILFTGDIGQHFKNRHSSHICFADDDEDPKKDGDEDKPVTITQSQLNELVANAVKAASDKSKDEDDKESITEKRAREEKEATELKNRDLKNQEFALSNLVFDSFVSKNEKLFGDRVKNIRSDVESSVGKDLSVSVPLMWATLAKEYFANETNLKGLTETDISWIKSNVTNTRFESDIDGMKAREYLERAAHNVNRSNDDEARRNGGSASNDDYQNYPNVKKYTENFFPKNRHEKGV